MCPVESRSNTISYRIPRRVYRPPLTIYNIINNIVRVVKAYTTLGVAIGVVFFGVVRGGFWTLI